MSEPEMEINIARDFSVFPAGRDDKDGPDNGSKFRETMLRPQLEAAIRLQKKLVVSLDGMMSFGSSFLEEAFGGLVRQGMTEKDIARSLEVRTSLKANERYVAAILRYIKKARG